MIGSNSAGSPEAAELTDMEAVRLAQQIAGERFLPISARHHEAYLAQRSRPSSPPTYDRAELEPIWVMLLAEAVVEVQTVRDPAVVNRLLGEAKTALAKRYPPVQAAPSSPPGQVPPTRR